MWLAEALWQAAAVAVAPAAATSREAERRRALETAARLMRAAVDGGREPRPAGLPARRAGRARAAARRIRSWGQGDDNRMTYWCPACQAGDDPPRRVTPVV